MSVHERVENIQSCRKENLKFETRTFFSNDIFTSSVRFVQYHEKKKKKKENEIEPFCSDNNRNDEVFEKKD